MGQVSRKVVGVTGDDPVLQMTKCSGFFAEVGVAAEDETVPTYKLVPEGPACQCDDRAAS